MYVLVCMDLGVISGFDAAGMVVDDDDDDADEGRSRPGRQGCFLLRALLKYYFAFCPHAHAHTRTLC